MTPKPIMSVSGLRGIVGTSLTPQLIQRFTAAYLRFLDDADIPGPLIVGRDGRDSGSDIAEQIQTIITSHGRDVFYGGILATPSLGIQIRQQQAAGGIQITASHNPLPYNGMKLYSPQGQILNQAQADQVLQNYQNRLDPKSSATESGSQATQLSKPHDPHLKALLETIDVTAIQQSAFHVLLDSNHGAGSPLGIRLLQHLNCQLTLLGETPDGQFSHPPEPTAQNLQSVAQHVLTESCDIGFCQDPDADRLALIDEQGRYIGEEYTLALCIEQRLTESPGNVVINCASSGMNHQIAEAHQCSCYESAVGEANVVEKMIATGAVFGGEGNGGPIDPLVGLIRDSFVGIVRVLDLMARRDQSLSEIVRTLPTCSIHKATREVGDFDLAAGLQSLPEQFPDAEPDWTDGLKLRWKDGRWLILRPSNTEPLVRAIAEAPTLPQAVQMCEQALNALD